jgi:tetratricopeptide (TPR) repeat protein
MRLLMKKLATLLILLSALSFGHAKAGIIDSLKQQLQVATEDSLKADIYAKLATCYLNFEAAPNTYTKHVYQENAINYTMLALHLYSKRADTTGLRISYSNLAKAYRAQNKFAQAKWFVLQANALSRQQKSIKDVVSTLVDLAAIKMDIHDYNLARKDLNEALRLAVVNNLMNEDIHLKQAFTRLYNFIKVTDEENIFTNDNLLKPSTYAVVTFKKRTPGKGVKAITSKRKIYTVSNKKVTDTNTIVSL